MRPGVTSINPAPQLPPEAVPQAGLSGPIAIGAAKVAPRSVEYVARFWLLSVLRVGTMKSPLRMTDGRVTHVLAPLANQRMPLVGVTDELSEQFRKVSVVSAGS